MKRNNFHPTPEYETPCLAVLNVISVAALAASGEDGITIGEMTEIDEEW